MVYLSPKLASALLRDIYNISLKFTFSVYKDGSDLSIWDNSHYDIKVGIWRLDVILSLKKCNPFDP